MRARLSALALGLLAAGNALAIFPDYGRDTQFSSVGFFTNTGGAIGSGVAIDPHWVLTAAHDGTTGTFTIPGATDAENQNFTVIESFVAPTTATSSPDLQLLHIAETLPSFTRIDLRSPEGAIATLVGAGITGTEISGGYSIPGNGQGVRRKATNRIEGFADITDADDNFLYTGLYYDLSSPSSPNRVANEGGIAGGDSGGGWFVDFGDGPRLVAVSEGIVGPNGGDDYFVYGAFGFGESLGAPEAQSFLNQHVPQATVPEPATFAALGLGLAALLRRHRR